MTRLTLALFLAGIFLLLASAVTLRPAAAAVEAPEETPAHTETPLPAVTSTPTSLPTAAVTGTAAAAPVEAAPGIVLGWEGHISCWNCAPFTAKIRVHHYNPTIDDGYSCFTWSDEFNHCMSNTASSIPWEGVYGLAAACPMEWPYGTWVVIPEAGTYICMDRGNEIVCKDGTCQVDILGPGGASWDGKEYEVTIWVPLKPRK